MHSRLKPSIPVTDYPDLILTKRQQHVSEDGNYYYRYQLTFASNPTSSEWRYPAEIRDVTSVELDHRWQRDYHRRRVMGILPREREVLVHWLDDGPFLEMRVSFFDVQQDPHLLGQTWTQISASQYLNYQRYKSGLMIDEHMEDIAETSRERLSTSLALGDHSIDPLALGCSQSASFTSRKRPPHLTMLNQSYTGSDANPSDISRAHGCPRIPQCGDGSHHSSDLGTNLSDDVYQYNEESESSPQSQALSPLQTTVREEKKACLMSERVSAWIDDQHLFAKFE